MLLVLLMSLCGCGQSGDDPLSDLGALVANRNAGSLSLIREENPLVAVNDLVQVGSRPNQLLARGAEVLVVNSDSDSLTVVEIESWNVTREYDPGPGCGPRMLALTSDSELLVTCFDSNELLLLDPDQPGGSDAVLARLGMPEGGALRPFQENEFGQARPLAVAVIGHRAYVTLTNLDNDLVETGPGLVLVVDVASWTSDKIIELPAVHPLAMHRSKDGRFLYISCLPGVVAILDSESDEISDVVQVDSVPGQLWEDPQGTVWVADQSAGRLMRFQAGSHEVDEPLILCPGRESIQDVATNGRGRVYASCFNSDTVWSFLRGNPESSMVSLPVGDGPGALMVIQK